METVSKVCTACGLQKSASEFYRNKDREGYLHPQCKPCARLADKLRRETNRIRNTLTALPEIKVCSKCGELRSCTEFYRQIDTNDGLHVWCKECFKSAASTYRRKRKEIKHIEGQCSKCTKPIHLHLTQCLRHHVASLWHWNRGSSKSYVVKSLVEKLGRQGGKCPYTGESIEIGVNAELDHIKPKSRFPDLIDDLDNVEWVSSRINRAKHHLTKEEFVDLCRCVTKYADLSVEDEGKYYEHL